MHVGADDRTMKLSIASLVCLAVAVLMLVVRGSADWSRSFAALWYGTFALAVALGLAAVVATIASRGVATRRRVVTVVLALPALVAVPLLIWTIVVLAPLAD
jgi:hypothetical protein